jgi:hypothetical protein
LIYGEPDILFLNFLKENDVELYNNCIGISNEMSTVRYHISSVFFKNQESFFTNQAKTNEINKSNLYKYIALQETTIMLIIYKSDAIDKKISFIPYNDEFYYQKDFIQKDFLNIINDRLKNEYLNYIQIKEADIEALKFGDFITKNDLNPDGSLQTIEDNVCDHPTLTNILSILNKNKNLNNSLIKYNDAFEKETSLLKDA